MTVRKQSPKQGKVIGDVMHEFKHGTLKSGSGRKVKSRKQAIAVALSEAGASKMATPRQNARNLRRTTRKKRASAK